MIVLILSILGLALLVLVFTRQSSDKDDAEDSAIINVPTEECCGEHEVCEADSLMNHTNRPIYYDDEELDRFAHKEVETYTEENINEFQDILYTLKDNDVAGWLKSLQLREIEVPLPVREEALLIVSERRFSNS